MKTQAYWSWVNGKFTQSPEIPSSSGGILHGYGVFETVYYRDQIMPYFSHHIERLESAATQTGLSLSSTAEELSSIIHELIRKNAFTEARVRISLLAQDTTYQHETIPCILLISATPYKRVVQPVQLLTVEAATFHCPLSTLKSTSYMGYLLAKRHAQQHGYDDAILLDHYGYAVECSTANLLFYKNGKWHSPPLLKSGLKGVQYKVLMQILSENGHLVSTRNLRHDEAWECGLTCNALMGIQPISQINNLTLPTDHHAFLKLYHTLKEWDEKAHH